MPSPAIALVSGANRGIGFETSRQLAEKGTLVLMGARSRDAGRDAAQRLRADGLSVEAVQLDVTRADHIAAVVQHIEQTHGHLDILVNNAGMIHPEDAAGANSTRSVSLLAMRETFEVNFFGAVALTQALLPLIEKSPAGRIVNVSSILGSLTLHGDESSAATQVKPLAYDASKTALNQFTVHLAATLKETAVKVNAAHPGWVRTAIGSQRAPLSPADGARTSVALATLPVDGPTGGFFHLGEAIPW